MQLQNAQLLKCTFWRRWAKIPKLSRRGQRAGGVDEAVTTPASRRTKSAGALGRPAAACSAARSQLLLGRDHALGVFGVLLLPLDLVRFDLLLTGPLSRGLRRFVTHGRLPRLVSDVLNGAPQGRGVQCDYDRSGEISKLGRHSEL